MELGPHLNKYVRYRTAGSTTHILTTGSPATYRGEVAGFDVLD